MTHRSTTPPTRANEAPTSVGIVGCGYIADEYVATLANAPGIRVAACADVHRDRAHRLSSQCPEANVLQTAQLISDAALDVVLILTPPAYHAPMSLASIAAGKHVYSEKPLGVTRAEAHDVLRAATDARLRIGVAPDTFLAAPVQACRHLIDRGTIGVPVAASLAFACPGHELWHPRPEFYYAAGGGPLFDIGPYFLTALVFVLGSIRAVTGVGRRTHAQRRILTGPNAGRTIDVRVPTHAVCLLELVGGPVVTCTFSFDVGGPPINRAEFYGVNGTLRLNNTASFGSILQLATNADRAWRTVPLGSSPVPGRGIGLLDMIDAIRLGRQHRASGELAYHVTDALAAVAESMVTGGRVLVESRCDRPAPLSSRDVG